MRKVYTPVDPVLAKIANQASLAMSNRNWCRLTQAEKNLVFSLQDAGYLSKKKVQDGFLI
jgi:hypothetical protein